MKRELAKLVADGFFREAIALYSQLHSASFRPHSFTFPPILKACGKLNSASQGKMIHSQIIRTGFCSDVYTSTALTGMYMNLHFLDDALQVFDEIPKQNLVSLNTVISGFSHSGHWTEALWVFKKGVAGMNSPNSVTIASVLSACECVENGGQVHCWAIKLGVEIDIYVVTSILTMYSNCGELISATKVFEKMGNKNVVSYNAFVSGLLQNGVPRMVLDVFKYMMEYSNEEPNSVTLVSVLSACASLLYIKFGKQVHGFIIKMDMETDTMVGTSLVDSYAKCGHWQWAYDVFKELNGKRNLITWNSMIAGMMLSKESDIAVELFERLEVEGFEPDSATWNSMISGFSQLGKGDEAVGFFRKMQSAGTVPSLKSITSLLSACSALSALLSGKEIHAHAIRTDIGTDEFMATALIDMYMKCGHSSWARKIFDQFEVKPDDPAFWNAMISGYGINGENDSAFEIFDEMQKEQVQPNSATFIAVLSVCSHTGQVDKGWQAFRAMNKQFGLNPKPGHFNCMVDLLGRSGKLDEARELINEMQEPSASVFASLLGACRCYSDPGLGEEMAMKLSQLEPENPTPFVILSNIYAEHGRWEDVERVRHMLNDRGLRKVPGFSSIGVQ